MVHVYIDDREKKLLSFFSNTPVLSKHLELGDIYLQLQDPSLEILIERKTFVDLWHSIVDHRFKEQRARLLEWQQTYKKVIYLIEMETQESIDPSKRDIVEKALHRLSFMYQFMVHRVTTIQQSYEYIMWLSQQTTLMKPQDTERDKIETWNQSLFPRKKEVQTTEGLLLILLMSIHGISHTTAKQITLGCHSLVEYIEKLKNIDPKEISEIQISSKRQLGIKKAQSIYSLFGLSLSNLNE